MGEASDYDIREQEARVWRLQADAILKAFDSIEHAQDIRYGPLTVVATSVCAVAAAFGAAIALLNCLS